MNKQVKFNYGQWTIFLTLDTSFEPEYCVRIICLGTWIGVSGSYWDSWDCAKYESPELLTPTLKVKITARARRMIYNYTHGKNSLQKGVFHVKRIITVKEFVDSYIEPTQHLKIEDLTSEHIYYTGLAHEIQNTDSIVYSARVERIDAYHGLTEHDGIVIYI